MTAAADLDAEFDARVPPIPASQVLRAVQGFAPRESVSAEHRGLLDEIRKVTRERNAASVRLDEVISSPGLEDAVRRFGVLWKGFCQGALTDPERLEFYRLHLAFGDPEVALADIAREALAEELT